MQIESPHPDNEIRRGYARVPRRCREFPPDAEPPFGDDKSIAMIASGGTGRQQRSSQQKRFSSPRHVRRPVEIRRNSIEPGRLAMLSSAVRVGCVLAMLITLPCAATFGKNGGTADTGWTVSAPPTMVRQINPLQFPPRVNSDHWLLTRPLLPQAASPELGLHAGRTSTAATTASTANVNAQSSGVPLDSKTLEFRPPMLARNKDADSQSEQAHSDQNNSGQLQLKPAADRIADAGTAPNADKRVADKRVADKRVADKLTANKPVADKPSPSAQPSRQSSNSRAAPKGRGNDAQGVQPPAARSPNDGPSDHRVAQRRTGTDEDRGGIANGPRNPESPHAGARANRVEQREKASDGGRSREIASRQANPRRVPSPRSVESRRLPALSQYQMQLRTKIRRVLRMYYKRPLNSRDHDAWEVMHGMLAYGVYSRILDDGPHGDPVTAVGWLCFNKPCQNNTLLYVTSEGELRAKWGVGVQGHYGQFLGMLAQCRVSRDYPIRVGDGRFTVSDLIESEKKTCHTDEELTFKLIALMHYCPSDETWINDQGAQWSIPRLIREELKQPIRGAPCGGTHRLAGLSLAAKTRVLRGEPLDGEFLLARQFVEKYHQYAFRLQNPDGSLSTEWFRGDGDDKDINRRIKTTGHILEWLLYSLDDDQMHNPRVIRAVNYLASLLYSNYSHEWEVGPMCHAIHALVLYDQRVYQQYDSLEEERRAIAAGQRTRTVPMSTRRR